jgi:tetratricopeptide (TPR) repeat protein
VLRICTSLLIFAFIGVSPATATTSRDVESTAEERLLADAADGTLDDISLLSAALIAGGIHDDAEAAIASASFNSWLETLREESFALEPRNRAEKIFEKLHSDIICGQYISTCSDVAVALEKGDFNCLSATILYICTARYCGLNARGLATDGHVLCEIDVESAAFEVETTCPKWFRLSHAEALAAKELRSTTLTASTTRKRELRRLSDVQLLAKVYYNRGVAALRDNQYEAGLALTRTSLLLDPDDPVGRGNVLAGLNNWALALCREGDPERAAKVLAELRSLAPDYPTLADNEAHIEQAKSSMKSP